MVGITAMVLTRPHRLVGVAETTAWFNGAKGYTLEVTLAVITVSYLAVLLRRLAKPAFWRRTLLTIAYRTASRPDSAVR
jgi:hypothetical protein